MYDILREMRFPAALSERSMTSLFDAAAMGAVTITLRVRWNRDT